MSKKIRWDITQELIEDMLLYNPATGDFIWKSDRPLKYFESERRQKMWKTRYGGKVAGAVVNIERNSYITIKIFSKGYFAHRLAWLYMTGSWPHENIDHLDGNGTNNAWDNLREVDVRTNCWNQRLRLNNTSGVQGVALESTGYAWRAMAGNTVLGRFKTKEEAVECRNNWAASFDLISDRHGKE